MRSTSTGALRSAFAADKPAMPPPTMTTFGFVSAVFLLDDLVTDMVFDQFTIRAVAELIAELGFRRHAQPRGGKGRPIWQQASHLLTMMVQPTALARSAQNRSRKILFSIFPAPFFGSSPSTTSMRRGTL